MERLTFPKATIKSIAYFCQVPLKMFFRYPTVRAGHNRFGIGDQPVRPRQQLHRILRVFQNSAMMHDPQFLGGHLIAPPPVRPHLGDQGRNLIFRNAQPSQKSFYGIGSCIIGHKGMSKTWLFFSRSVHPCRDCNDHQGFPFGPSSPLARKCRPKERFVHLNQAGQPIHLGQTCLCGFCGPSPKWFCSP
jgi:hypothetical protein